tara:strand:- start:121 stop:393 length:273 start_codon:yes stop_codon:yes gene_type:complete
MDMLYLINLLLLFIPLSTHAEGVEIKQLKSAAVPHNNGTGGLLKNIVIDPIENFNIVVKDPHAVNDVKKEVSVESIKAGSEKALNHSGQQ